MTGVMAHLRKDPILGDWVIVAPDRATRPFDATTANSVSPSELCPFCRGHEEATPAAVLTLSEGKDPDDWDVRIIPNRFPAVVAATSTTEPQTDSFFEQKSAAGYHEVIVESPQHHRCMRDLDCSQVLRVARAWRDRLKAVSADESVAHTMLFKNEGARAGASLEHVHSQLLATSFIPSRIEAELDAAENHASRTGRLLWDDIVDRELDDDVRLVMANEHFVLLCPFASRSAGEMCLLPRNSSPFFETTSDACLEEFATVLVRSFQLLHYTFPEAPFNLAMHSAPPRDHRSGVYRWHLTMTPRLTGIAGFELGAGSWINIMTPEATAASYRAAAS